jgi:hypothetical protein
MFGLIRVLCRMHNGIILLKTKINYENKDFPADFIAEGVDQTVVGFIPYTLLEP